MIDEMRIQQEWKETKKESSTTSQKRKGDNQQRKQVTIKIQNALMHEIEKNYSFEKRLLISD